MSLATSMNMPFLPAEIRFFYTFIFGLYMDFVDRTASEMIRNGMRGG